MVGLSELSYAERLRALNLFSIRGRFLRSDLIKYWKILCSYGGGCDLSGMFRRSNSRTRGHRHKLLLPLCVTDVRKRFFNVRCIGIWNSLPASVVESSSLAGFKAALTQFLGDLLFEFL